MSERIEPILIVEADHGVGDLLQRTLFEAGHETARVVDGQQALAWLTRTRPPLLLLDLDLPDMHGETVASAAREQYGNDLVIVVITENLRVDPRLPPVRAAGVLALPIVPEELLATVRRFRH